MWPFVKFFVPPSTFVYVHCYAWLGADVVICQERGADLHVGPADVHSLSLASVKSRLVLPVWYRLTRVVPDKGPVYGCVCTVHGFHLHCCLTDSVPAADLEHLSLYAAFRISSITNDAIQKRLDSE